MRTRLAALWRRHSTTVALLAFGALFVWQAGSGTSFQPTAAAKEAPAFALRDVNGREVSLSSLRGRPVLLNFWAEWCPPCRAELPELEALAQAAPSCLSVVGIAVDGDARTLASFARDQGLTYPILLDDSGASRRYGVGTIPHSVLIDAQGRVVGDFRGVVTRRGVEAELEKLSPAPNC